MPEGVSREETLDAFVAAYATQGYSSCENAELETGFEKVAVYADKDGKPTHAAKQLTSGIWTSKLGCWEDIEHHALESVCCEEYGKPATYLKRPIRASS